MGSDKTPQEMSDGELIKAYNDYYHRGNINRKSIVFGAALAQEVKRRGLNV